MPLHNCPLCTNVGFCALFPPPPPTHSNTYHARAHTHRGTTGWSTTMTTKEVFDLFNTSGNGTPLPLHRDMCWCCKKWHFAKSTQSPPNSFSGLFSGIACGIRGGDRQGVGGSPCILRGLANDACSSLNCSARCRLGLPNAARGMKALRELCCLQRHNRHPPTTTICPTTNTNHQLTHTTTHLARSSRAVCVALSCDRCRC
jgi:hypothetical protein